MNESSLTRQAGRREWLGLVVLTLPCLLISMDLSVLHLAVPALSASLHPTGTELLWIVDIYGFGLAGCLITMGNLGDRLGRRRVLVTGAAAFGVTSTIAAFSVSPEMLIAARALMGVSAATLMPSTLGLLRHMFADPRQRTVAIGVWGTSLSLGGALGPVVGGALLEAFWWGSVLLIAVPVMTLLLVLAPRLLPEVRDPHAGPVDLPSSGLSILAVLAAVYALKRLAADGGDAQVLVAALLAGAALISFVRRQGSLARPLVDLALFRRPAFCASLGANALGFGVLFGIDLFLVQYLQLVHGLDPLTAGLWTLPGFAAFIAVGMLAPQLVRRVRPGELISGGLLLAALGLLTLGQITATGGLTVFVVGSVVLSLGLGPVFTLATDTTISAAPTERAGAASSLSETSTELGGALGIAVIGSLGTAVYRAHLDHAAVTGLPPHAAATARGSLGGAAAVAQQLPGHGTALIDAAQHALIAGLHAATVAGAGLVLAAAILTAVLLRRPAVGRQDTDGQDVDLTSEGDPPLNGHTSIDGRDSCTPAPASLRPRSPTRPRPSTGSSRCSWRPGSPTRRSGRSPDTTLETCARSWTRPPSRQHARTP